MLRDKIGTIISHGNYTNAFHVADSILGLPEMKEILRDASQLRNLELQGWTPEQVFRWKEKSENWDKLESEVLKRGTCGIRVREE